MATRPNPVANGNGSYRTFLDRKAQFGSDTGFAPVWMPNFLFDFQHALVDWALHRGRAAIFADCGLGKTPMQLVWAENVVRKKNKPVLIVTPLAVTAQTMREAEKFSIECVRSQDGRVTGPITVTNYERLHHFTSEDFAGVVCDESSILKNFDGVRRGVVTEFLRTRPYRLLCTATAAPNDYTELGTTSEALGELGFMDMLGRFFKNDLNTVDTKRRWARGDGGGSQWRFKRHAEQPFWRWVSSWARALRRPSDLGFDDARFILPPLTMNQTVLEHTAPLPGMLFNLPAVGLGEQRAERRATLEARCEAVAELVKRHDRSLVWCHLNSEGDLLTRLIPDAVQVSGQDDDAVKEERFLAFADGRVPTLVTKPVCGGFGLNFQRCAHVTFFPSHSFEQFYQGVRRCWRFGQEREVVVDIVTTPGEANVLKNLQRKQDAADKMFTELVNYMRNALTIMRDDVFSETEEVPAWL